MDKELDEIYSKLKNKQDQNEEFAKEIESLNDSLEENRHAYEQLVKEVDQ